MPTPQKNLLHSLARLYDIQTAYYDIFGRLNESPPEGVLRVLGLLGAPVEGMEDLPDALRERHQALWQRGIDPILVAWDGGPLKLKLRLPHKLAERLPRYHVELESGERREGQCSRRGIRPLERTIEGARYAVQRLIVPETLPFGYHRLKLDLGGQSLESRLVACPAHAYAPGEGGRKAWGVFAPLYALQSERSWGAGDISDLAGLTEWVEQLGGEVVGTLPLLGTFLNEPFDPSPYSPVSRLFWNEFYLDVAKIPELQHCPAARELMDSAGFRSELARLGASPFVEYRPLMALKRQVIEKLAQCVATGSSERQRLFQRFVATHPLADDYAAFRAKIESERKPWGQWTEANRNGALAPGDYDEGVKQYHLYVQWQAHEQMRALGEKAKAGGPALYLDFPLGVNRDGYDVWRERAVFALEASGGAPPDGFFTKGQDWGFPPLHPEGLRRQGYRYYIRCLRHHLQYSGMLRIDHVMGLHRLYWVPRGLDPTQGVYVRYPAEEFYAILNLESHRHRAQIVGENLGTVPPYVNAAMSRHKICGMYVGQFGIYADRQEALEEIPSGTVASLNTHDTPTFGGFWSGADIRDRLELGLLTESESAAERQRRALQREALVRHLKARGRLSEESPDARAVLKAWLSHMAEGNADLLLVNLEDLWLEPLPQNVPGTWEERPNWKRRAAYRLETIFQMHPILDILKTIDEIRKGRG